MAYRMEIGGVTLLGAGNDSVSTVQLSQNVNEAAWLDFEISSDAGANIAAGITEIVLYWDSTVLFRGRVESVEGDLEGVLAVTVASDLDRLNDITLPPHSSDGETGELCYTERDKYVSWLFAKYNERASVPITLRENDAASVSGSPLAIEVDDYGTTVAEALTELLEDGGYIVYDPEARAVDFVADISTISSGGIIYGDNITSATVTRSSDGLCTALVPVGDDITLDDATDTELQLIKNSGFEIYGDAIYDPEAGTVYGYRDGAYSTDDTDINSLVRGCMEQLAEVSNLSITIDARAVDMALYDASAEPLRIGQVAQVTIPQHGIDGYMMITGIDVDLLEPGETVYTLGASHTSLTKILDSRKSTAVAVSGATGISTLTAADATTIADANSTLGTD